MLASAIEVAWQQVFELGERSGARELGEDEAEVGDELERVGLGGLDQAVERLALELAARTVSRASAKPGPCEAQPRAPRGPRPRCG